MTHSFFINIMINKTIIMKYIKTYSEYIGESLWSDMQRRAEGSDIRKEDENYYYQPISYSDNGTDIEYGDIPEELKSFQVFHTENDAKKWLENNDYDPNDFIISKYEDDDIEDHVFIDEFGNDID